jgi:hypothetical protein
MKMPQTEHTHFRSLASDFIHPRLQADTDEEDERAASAFTASIASAYRLAARKLALSNLNNAPLGLDHFLQLKRRLRKLWQETRDPTCKTALNWVTKTIHKMVRRNAIERWETKLSNAETTLHAFWPLVKSLKRGDKIKAPTAIQSPMGLKFLQFEKATVIADCLETQFSPEDLCEEHHEQLVVTRIQALFEAVDSDPPERIRPCDVQKINPN